MADSSSSDWDALARECATLAAFLDAGLPSSVAWRVVVTQSGQGAHAAPPDDLIIAWRASVHIGAPLATTCRYLGESFTELSRIAREVDTARAGPVFASRIMLTLPFVGMLLAAALGLNALTFLFASPLGWACLTLGLGLLGFARWWSRRLIASVNARDVPHGVSTAVVAAALSVGVGPRVAREALELECDRVGAPRIPFADHTVRERSAAWGIPVAQLLLADARLERDRALARVRAQAAELGERLLVPLGACVLPAFVLLSVVPIVVELVAHSGITWGE